MALRRNTRLRREYLYRRSLQGKEQEMYEKKRRVKEALKEGKPIPTELMGVASALADDLEMEDDQTFAMQNALDDEYATAGITPPKVMVTTSHNPSSKLVQFAKEMKLLFPDAQRMNRGGHVLQELVEASRRHGVTDLVIVHETRGRPDGLTISHLPSGPTAYFSLTNVVTRHDIRDGVDNMSTTAPHLIFNNFNTNLGKRVVSILKHLFPPPKDDSQRVLTFANNDDFISFRHHTWEKEGHKDVTLEEVGPRFEMRLYKIRLGTLDQVEAEDEYVLRNYTNTGRKRSVL
eukprot:TRINITY_DN4432_c0_g2_i2.p1 TRINITY_DN4432_c0_g2~~TRINITY_DN4432_c0_g2_i2.p1  ORF type:complete len:290 (-),score=60.29 TRINITY_DN4432_c0_g2_i2:40-909(-)